MTLAPLRRMLKPMNTGASRMPVAFIPHGGGPWPFVDLGIPAAERDRLINYLQTIRGLPQTPPKALLVVSAHWEERIPTLMTAPQPPLLFDYYGFPEASYKLTWPAPNSPEVAARVRELLTSAGFESAADEKRGYDHGTFVPLKVAYPQADVPVVQLSLVKGLDPELHLRLGRALAPLRDEGVFIIGSGMTYHDLRALRTGEAGPVSRVFDAWLRESVTLESTERDARLIAWSRAPAARRAHPREEHLIPLMVAAGAAGADRGTLAFHGEMYGVELSGYHFAA